MGKKHKISSYTATYVAKPQMKLQWRILHQYTNQMSQNHVTKDNSGSSFSIHSYINISDQ